MKALNHNLLKVDHRDLFFFINQKKEVNLIA